MGEFTVTGLRVVREAARSGSFTRAAERLGYTQSAVSRQITLMEQAAGTVLFERRARGVQPTDAGRIVLRHAETVLDALATAGDELRNPLPSGRLRVGAFSSATAALVPAAIAAVTTGNPAVRVHLREGTTPALLSALTKNRIDVAVLSGDPDRPGDTTFEPLLDDSLFLAVHPAHRFATRASVPVAELRAEPWITGSNDIGTTLLGAWSGPSWQPRIAHTARDWIAKLGLVSAGLGVTIVPGLAVSALPARLSIIRIDDPQARRPTHLAYRSGTIPPDHLFLEALRDTAATLAADIRARLRT
ncbi:LysR family transcriptional regulator [Nocardia tengchongensis]|uniref:LysR family transcriptional regulator n=1 Tax=Nocardia tengchongensis TaxID=2055889 RepID=UPI00364621FB